MTPDAFFAACEARQVRQSPFLRRLHGLDATPPRGHRTGRCADCGAHISLRNTRCDRCAEKGRAHAPDAP